MGTLSPVRLTLPLPCLGRTVAEDGRGASVPTPASPAPSALLFPAVTTIPSRCRQGPADARGTASDFYPYPARPPGVGAWRGRVKDLSRKKGWRRWELGGRGGQPLLGGPVVQGSVPGPGTPDCASSEVRSLGAG